MGIMRFKKWVMGILGATSVMGVVMILLAVFCLYCVVGIVEMAAYHTVEQTEVAVTHAVVRQSDRHGNKEVKCILPSGEEAIYPLISPTLAGFPGSKTIILELSKSVGKLTGFRYGEKVTGWKPATVEK